MKYKVYCLKDKYENVKYVGMTSKSLKVRYSKHCVDFPKRREYHIELIHQFDNKEDAIKAETYYIKYYDTVVNGDNITYGVGRLGIGANITSFKEGNKFGCIPSYYFICNETGDFGTAKYLADILGCNRNKIYDVVKGIRKSVHGYSFSYISKETFNDLKAIPR